MSLYWDHAISQSDLLRAFYCLQPTNNMKLYKLFNNTWHTVTIALLQQARNIQTIIEALVYNRSRLGKLCPTARRSHITIPELCRFTLMQTIINVHLDNPPTTPPTDNPTLTQMQ